MAKGSFRWSQNKLDEEIAKNPYLLCNYREEQFASRILC